MNKLKVAVIGTGMIANSAHFPALNILRKEGLIEVVGVADVREEAAAETAKRHDVPNYYTDPQKLLDECKPDFVAVCTPNMYHKEWTIKALQARTSRAKSRWRLLFRTQRRCGRRQRTAASVCSPASVCAGETICSSRRNWQQAESWVMSTSRTLSLFVALVYRRGECSI